MSCVYTQPKDVVVGSVIADMHYGAGNIALGVPHDLVSHVTWNSDKGSAMIEALVGCQVTNKMLVVVDLENRRGCLVAMYSYDARTVGVIELAVRWREANDA